MDDTDTLIALVASILPQGSIYNSPESILSALVEAGGNVDSAVHTLLCRGGEAAEKCTTHVKDKLDTVPSSTTSGKKRKRSMDIESWLKSKSKQRNNSCGSDDSACTPSTSSSVQPLKSPSKPRASPLSGPGAAKSADLMSLLRPPPSANVSLPRLAPMTLNTPELVAQHTPCTLHHSVLPSELACRLFYTMMDESKAWKRNKWWLFDRVVESPHLTSFFARRTNGLDDDETWQEAAQFWYNGRKTEPPSVFPPEMEEACRIVENIVNQEIHKRAKRYRLEWQGGTESDTLWRANVAASNCYQGSKESVGFHSDQLTYLGPYPTIASLSLGTRRMFSLREVVPTTESGVRRAQTFNIPLPHNSLTIMHASCQERFKHSIPPQSAIDLFRPAFPKDSKKTNSVIEPSNCRINITFRFYRPDFRPETIPRCLCGVPTILRPDMKNRNDGETDRYWWTCYAGAQNEGKGCNFWKVMDMEQEGRGTAYKRENQKRL